MTAIKWLSRPAIEIIHSEQLAEHGGLVGITDENALESALVRPLHKNTYGEEDIFVLAAAYVYKLARNHPFSDGNKRTAYLAAFTFLLMNGYLIEATQAQIVILILGVAAGEIDEDGLTRFLRDHTVPYP
ncbi:type II toxin-antitoxin system death-on-curing family toxin [Rhizobiales bacterium RZME27]|uniref:Type II toxin-antitoxin system death-on-curing family toxin n=1 Tax=Endobacterium cereale TaxID=2663029 RepID=A0A6A8AGS8_9HYPH|nr:type II toxin-antitoxin system death-on-curing family toxin [Endobacterium cereale]MEB2844014.1 type II toxin-antitoxin system death-on-curing family toxin [Endobacterium cereale]MQY48426.1 type II toxin-antitoxin system death-on-curing family toxin [Endobacterium cereale]